STRTSRSKVTCAGSAPRRSSGSRRSARTVGSGTGVVFPCTASGPARTHAPGRDRRRPSVAARSRRRRPRMAPPRRQAARGRTRRRVKKNIAIGQAHIKTSFNNTIVALTDGEGNVIAWESAGSAGFKGSRKSTPFAAQVTADSCARKGMEHGLQKVEVFVKGPGSGRETAIRSLQAAGLEILGVKDVT